MGACIASGFAVVFQIIFQLIMLVVFASVIVSFVGDPSNRFVQIIYSISEPIYKPFRRLTSRIGGPIDFTPFIVLILVSFLQKALVGTLAKMGMACQNVGF